MKGCWQINVQRCSSEPAKRVLGCAVFLWKRVFWNVFPSFLETNPRNLGVGRNFGRVLIDEVSNLPKCILYFCQLFFLWKMKFSLLSHRFTSEKIVQVIGKIFVIDVAQNKQKCNFECYVPLWKIKLWGSSNTSFTSERQKTTQSKWNQIWLKLSRLIFSEWVSVCLENLSYNSYFYKNFDAPGFCSILILISFRHPLLLDLEIHKSQSIFSALAAEFSFH